MRNAVRFLLIRILCLSAAAGVACAQESAGRGPVRAESVWSAYAWNGSDWRESVVAKRLVDAYSPEGLLLSSVLSLISGGVFEKSEYLYSGSELLKIVTRDGQGNLLRATRFSRESAPAANGLRSRLSETVTADGVVVSSQRQYFDGFGLMVAAETLDSAGNPALTLRFRYDSAGRRIQELAVAPDGSLAWQISSAYGDFDQGGNWRERVESESYRSMWNHPRYIVRRSLEYPGAAE
jgi:hypothetical protein